MTKIYLVRHGEAEGNAFRRLHGQYDSLLTPVGHRQVAALRERFRTIPIDACYASDLTRTSLTARAIYVPQRLPLRRQTCFREVHVGRWEDLPFGHLERFEPRDMQAFNQDPPGWHVEGAERFDAYTQRFLDGLRAAAAQWDGGTIAVFCHGAVLRGVLMRLFFWNNRGEIPYSDNTAVSLLTYGQSSFTYEFLNDNSHLSPEISTFSRQQWWRTGGSSDHHLWFQPAAAAFSGLPAGPDAACVMAGMLGDRLAGAVWMNFSGGTGQISELWLSPEYQGMNLEDQLLGCAVSRCRRERLRSLTAPLQSSAPDGLFARYGFQKAGNQWQAEIAVPAWTDDGAFPAI